MLGYHPGGTVANSEGVVGPRVALVGVAVRSLDDRRCSGRVIYQECGVQPARNTRFICRKTRQVCVCVVRPTEVALSLTPRFCSPNFEAAETKLTVTAWAKGAPISVEKSEIDISWSHFHAKPYLVYVYQEPC